MSDRHNFAAITLDPITSEAQSPVNGAGNAELPKLSNGNYAKYYHFFAHSGTETNTIFISLHEATGTNGAAAGGFALPVRGKADVIVNAHGFSHYGFDDVGAGDSILQVTPLADF